MTDKALLIGINKYVGAPLAGCVNDIDDMANYLEGTMKFAATSIHKLVDERATRETILNRLGWLTTEAKPGDRLVFHYSGHGTQVATRTPNLELDGLDEVICPVDFDWDDAHLIRDKTLHGFFAQVPAGVRCVWVADCCHSGSLDRELRPRKKGTNSPKILGIRWLPPPSDHAWRIHAARSIGMETNKIINISNGGSPLHVAFVSGCKDTQTSADASFGGRPNGALTYFFLKALKAAKPGTAFSAIVESARKMLAKAGYEQVPQMDGAELTRPFLG